MDKDHITTLIRIGGSDDGLRHAQEIATAALKKVGVAFPKKGCAANLSALLQLAGIDIPMTLGAGSLAQRLGGKLNSRRWDHVPVGEQEAGDIGVCFDNTPPDGADHIYLVVERLDNDQMVIADNQDTTKHRRSANGKGVKTPTDYFLRAPGMGAAVFAAPLSISPGVHAAVVSALAAHTSPASMAISAPVVEAEFSIGTDLKTVKSPLTAVKIEEFFNMQPGERRGLLGIGEPIIAAAEKYGINATYIVAHAILETGWGRSKICREKNNLFGWEAFDTAPQLAKGFLDRATCIDFVMGRVDELYLKTTGKYFRQSPCVGNKSFGMNVNYAAESDWGADIASIARRIERSV